MDSITYMTVPRDEWLEMKSIMRQVKALLAPKDDFLTTEQACRMLGVTKNTFSAYRKKYNIPVSQVGRNILVPRSEIEKLIKKTKL